MGTLTFTAGNLMSACRQDSIVLQPRPPVSHSSKPGATRLLKFITLFHSLTHSLFLHLCSLVFMVCVRYGSPGFVSIKSSVFTSLDVTRIHDLRDCDTIDSSVELFYSSLSCAVIPPPLSGRSQSCSVHHPALRAAR